MATASATAPAARWFAIHTHPQHEPLAALNLRRQDYRVLWLHYRAEIRHARKIRQVLRSYFPRYLFCAIADSQGLGPINRTAGVAAIVSAGQEALEVPNDIIDQLSARADEDGLLAPLPARSRPLLASGSHVQIVSGPLIGFPGIVVLDEGNRIRLDIKMLGRYIEASIEPDAVTAISPALRRAP
jgi:transcription antitermination factor NusG